MMSEHIQPPRDTTIDISQLSILSDRLLSFEAKNRPIFIHISGASGAGKTTCGAFLSELLHDTSIFEMDRYLKGQKYVYGLEESVVQADYFYGWDDIRVFDLPVVAVDLRRLQQGETVSVPLFDRQKGERQGEEAYKASLFTIVEGIHALNPIVSSGADIKILVVAPFHDRLMRRIVRNHLGYGLRPMSKIIANYIDRVEPSYAQYHDQYRLSADYIVNNPANPDSEFVKYRELVSQSDASAIKIVEQYTLYPFVGNGLLHSGEEMTVSQMEDNSWLFRYSVGNTQYISDIIDGKALRGLKKRYEFTKYE